VAVDEETPVAEVELDDEPVAELDLDEDAAAEGAAAAGVDRAGADGAGADGTGADGTSAGDAGGAGGAGWWPARWTAARPGVAIALTSALLGGGLVHVVQSARERGETTVSVALGEAGGGLLNRRLGNWRVIRLSTVALNEGPSAVTIRGVRVDGDGAGLTRTFRGEASIYPFQLDPGETANMPLALTADCDVRAPQAPSLRVDVTAEDGTQRTLDVRLPGLDELWRRATTAEACADS
jgi:hypothetical protein